MIVFIKTPPKYRKRKYNKNKNAHKIAHTLVIFVEHGVMAHVRRRLSQ